MKVIVFGYAPVGMIEALKAGKWDPSGFPDRLYFNAIMLAGWFVVTPVNKLYSTHCKVTVKDEAGESFSIEGFCTSDMIPGMTLGGPPFGGGNKIGEHELSRRKSKKHPCRYEIMAETI